MNTAFAALIGLVIAIGLIIKKVPPVYCLMLGAVAGGLLGGYSLPQTVDYMVAGVKDITPAIIRILAAGVLSGVLIKTGAATSISRTIIMGLGNRHVFLALALSTMLLTGVGVFIDVAVITVAPIALVIGQQLGISKFKLLLTMIAGGKCGNIISPNPNTIIAAENFNAPLSSVMAVNLIPAIVGVLVTVYILIPIMSSKGEVPDLKTDGEAEDNLPSFWGSMSGPLAAVVLLALRPIAGVVIDPLIALPVGGLVCIAVTRRWAEAMPSIRFGLEKMSVIAVLLVGTGAIAGIIKVSAIKDVLLATLSHLGLGESVIAPVAGALMSAATASTTAGATIASASFAEVVLAAGVSAVWGAAMVNAGATVLDHLPHGSFFHATTGSVDMNMKEGFRLISYQTLVGLILTLMSVACYWVMRSWGV